MGSGDALTSQGPYSPAAKDMPFYKIRAEKCAIVRVKSTIYNENSFYRWDAFKWRGDGERTRGGDSMPIDSVVETEVDVPMLRRQVILTPGPCFFTVKAEGDFVFASVGKVESAIRKGLPLNALVIPGNGRVVIEPARHSPTPYDLERRGESEMTRQLGPPDRDDRLAAEALMELRRDLNTPGHKSAPLRSSACPPLSILFRYRSQQRHPCRRPATLHYGSAVWQLRAYGRLAAHPRARCLYQCYILPVTPMVEQTVRYEH